MPGERNERTELKSSADWLETHSLHHCGLTLSHLLSLCSHSQQAGGCDRSSRQLWISATALQDFELQLYRAIEMYHSRIQWLSQDSMRVFGVVKGSKLGVLIDTSDVSSSSDRLPDLQHNLLRLIEEQLCAKEQLYLMSFNTEVNSLRHEPRDVNAVRLQEAREWVLKLDAAGGCNLLEAVKRALTHTQLNSLLIILNSCPAQHTDVVCDYLSQCMLGRDLAVHSVAYNSSRAETIHTVKRLASATGGQYHLFSAALGVVEGSTDLDLLWGEIKAAREVLCNVEKMQQCLTKDPMLTLSGEVLTDLERLQLCDSGLIPHTHAAPLNIQPAEPLPTTSSDWLETHGLSAQRLDLYQLLAPNAYSPLKEFVPILGKTVSSTVHERAMDQCEWHDRTVKNVHVNLPLLYNYQRQLGHAMAMLERRILWLSSTNSRQIWGSVCEQRVNILVEMSSLNVHYRPYIQHFLRLLLQEQLANTQYFNVILFGSDIVQWKEQAVPSEPENLQAVWQWMRCREFEGGRDTLKALRFVLGGPPEEEESSLSGGIYLLTSGVPEEEMAVAAEYISERCSVRRQKLHVCLFTGEDMPSCPLPCYATPADNATALHQLAHAGNGRFHWVSTTGIIESDDIRILIDEMEKAVNYWEKASLLVDSLTQRCRGSAPEESLSPTESVLALSTQSRGRRERLPPPRHTTLTQARLLLKEKSQSPQAAKTWRPNSAKANIPPARPVHGWGPVDSVSLSKQRGVKVSQSVFYMEDGQLGMVFKTYSKPKSVWKLITPLKLPKTEEICSTKRWLKRFGINKLKLDLHKLVSGPECTHQKTLVPAIRKTVSAQYCCIFPSVQLNGRVCHLRLSCGELRQYLTETDRLLRRYCQRMQWLLKGSRCVFGTVLEKAVCILLDISGSMAPCLPQLKRDLGSLIWEQLHKQRVRFSLVAFSGEIRVWRFTLTEASDEECRDAVQWLEQLTTHGATSTVEALQTACGFADSLGVYMISDGRPESSCSLVLRETERLTAEKHITIHTVSVNDQDSTANEFLQNLAHMTGGRFHCTPAEADARAANKVLADGFREGEEPELPEFQSDDLRRLKEEIDKLRLFQQQAKVFRLMFFYISL
ncbi:von Willebrand factor A domain-containing protein 3A [Chanos chanos]|uniref:von Willebrand factor A domain-containing protein 3A n=1 Tax=Chanos chanos TaxID=29144 RepID=A0A6J2WPN1_CHACN|nr:von Willebrand factor A domain-containing protein 3A [Chanos chanos]